MPYAEVFTNVFVRVFRQGTKYFKKSSTKSGFKKECLIAEFTGHASVPYSKIGKRLVYFLSVQK